MNGGRGEQVELVLIVGQGVCVVDDDGVDLSRAEGSSCLVSPYRVGKNRLWTELMWQNHTRYEGTWTVTQ